MVEAYGAASSPDLADSLLAFLHTYGTTESPGTPHVSVMRTGTLTAAGR
jgi:hypothetical protein